MNRIFLRKYNGRYSVNYPPLYTKVIVKNCIKAFIILCYPYPPLEDGEFRIKYVKIYNKL
ncbi:hypothetical protein CPJCM30710_07360 [Clostridium polyendosporum]|uniref:Uncharacterized protein n=1 Tax=Clostridium polyendosporum TaxID=69208 RepID=A0A919RX29_9CLOT|nr:hypothetical protein CPJCM30710_07360 [Clostridium polyendosporum]